MRRLSGYPTWLYRATIGILVSLLLSAVLLIPNTLEMRLDLDIRLGWRRRMNRLSGCLLLIRFVLLLFSAVDIYYLGDPDLSRFTSLFHSVIGLTLILFFIWHSIRGRRIRAQAHH